VAARHERLAVRAAPPLHDLHLTMATIHRDIERRHQAAARMHSIHTRRLTRWRRGTRTLVPPRFIGAVAATLGARHVGLSLLGGDRTEAVAVGSDRIADAAQDLEFTLGEGPAHDVAAGGGWVVARPGSVLERWPRFAPAVSRLGVRAVAAAPLTADGGCLGSLTVFDPPSDVDRSVELLCTVADALVSTALLVPSGREQLFAGDGRTIVHQASGMLAEQLGCGTGDALALLRARAFAEDAPVADVADAVVHGRLRMTP
jgi:hypothetical protein